MIRTVILRRPFVLEMGARVDVVAPSSGFDEASFADGLQVLRDFGLVPILGEHVRDRAGYLAGEDALRTADLRHALLRKDTQAVFCARGGYGLTRLLPALLRDTEVLGALGDKLLVGFSDVTALHALCLRQGAASLHGPVVTSLRRVGDASRELLRRLLFEPRGLGVITPDTAVRIAGGRARGLVVGGNLSVLTRLIGTAVWPSLEGRILLLEDVGERPYRLDRMLTHLLLAGHTITIGLAWLPLVLLGLERAIRSGGVWPTIGAGIAYALLLLGTHPQWAFYSGVFVAAWTGIPASRRNQAASASFRSGAAAARARRRATPAPISPAATGASGSAVYSCEWE